MTKNTIAIYLPDHGVFCSTIEAIEQAATNSKEVLAQCLADIYGGVDAHGTKSYWLRSYSKHVLAIVYAGCQTPVSMEVR